MQFLYNENAGKSELELKNEAFKHLKARRVRLNDSLNLRNLNDDFLYIYTINELKRSSCTLILQEKNHQKTPIQQKLSLAMGVIELKNVEKILPFLNELGLYKLIFVFTAFSQRNFVLDFDRLKRILISSCEQCGRTNLMDFECFNSSKDFAKTYPNAVMVDFSAKNDDLSTLNEKDVLFVGAEGGFNDEEKALFERKIRLKSPYILKSQSAVLALAAKILL